MMSTTIIASILIGGHEPSWLTPKFLDVIRQVESGGNDRAVSPVGAMGPYQFMPLTWKELGQNKFGFTFEDIFDEPKARKVCEYYYHHLNNIITKQSHKQATWQQCAAAYNSGIGRLRRNNWKWDSLSIETTHYIERIKCQLSSSR